MTTGPFLYDDDPAPLHTGTPRRGGRLLVLALAATVLVAVLLVVLRPVFKGTPEEQATEVAGVFLAALQQGDTETSDLLLCEDERNRLAFDEVADEYLVGDDGRVVSAVEEPRDGRQVLLVEVRWAGGRTSEWTVIAERGAKVCGTSG